MLKALRKFLDRVSPPVAGGIHTVLPPVAVIPPSPSKAVGFFDNRFVVMPEESWDGYLRRIDPFVFQKKAGDFAVISAQFATDGAVEFAQDNFDLGGSVNKGFYNLTGGSPVPLSQSGWYAAQSFIGYQMCAVLAQHWLIDKACTMPARDAVRNGWDIVSDGGEKLKPEIVAEFRKLEKRFKVKENCVQAVRKCRIFGVRVILFEVTSADDQYYEKPFNPDGIAPGSYKGISQIDPYWIAPELDYSAAANPAGRHFYEPTYWNINGRRYHRSHLIVLKTNEVPDILKPAYFFGGVPLPQVLYERVYAAERTANEGPQLALTKRLTVLEGVDMSSAASRPEEFRNNLQKFAYLRDNYGILALGGTEKLNQQDTALGDVDVVIMTQYQLVCAIAEVPATKMLGTMPKGFNATGEYDEASYHESLESIQEHDMAPIIERHTLMAMRSFVCPKLGIKPFEVSIDFAELDAETALEHATRTNTEAERDLKWSQTGAIDGIDVRNRLRGDKESGYSGIEEAIPPGPTPSRVVQPGAPLAAPNTLPGQTPTPAPAASPTGGGAASPAAPQATGHDEMDAALVGMLDALSNLERTQ